MKFELIMLFRWMQSRKRDDNAEGLWRVHDTLYDLTEFIDLHPGGADWIKLTKVESPFSNNSTIYSSIFSKIIIPGH